MGDFTDKVVLVTGAGKGAGRAIAEAFAARGALVAANDVTPINLDETAARITASGGRVRAYVEDVAKKMPVQTLVKAVQDDWGRIDILVNCAEVEPRAPLLEMDDWDWQRTLDVNLSGTFLLMQNVGRVMRAQGGGVMVNLGARARDPEKRAAYLASKAGLVALTEQAAGEFAAENIRVYLVAPGEGENLVEKVISLAGAGLPRSEEVKMEKLLEYRQRFLDKLSAAPDELRAALAAIPDPRAPLEAGSWNLHQVLVHMRDVNVQVYPPRLYRILDEENPTFENFDGDAWMAAHYDPNEPLEAIQAEFARQCAEAADRLRNIPAEAWSRPGTHPAYGTHTLQWWAERMLAHIEEHLAQLQRGKPV